MTEQDIERIVTSCGYACVFEDHVGHGDGTLKRYVKVATRGRNRRTKSLGRVEKVQLLDQDALVKLINEKFTERR